MMLFVKSINRYLLKPGWLLIFPMVLAAASGFAEGGHPIADPSFRQAFSVVPERMQLLNKRQLGVFFRVTDNRGLFYQLDSSAIQQVELDHKSVPVWQLEWYSVANPYRQIETLTGFKRFFSDDFNRLRMLGHDFFRANRTTHRIEIQQVSETTLADEQTDPLSTANNRLIRLIGQKLPQGKGLGQEAGVQIVWKTPPSEKLVALLSKQQNRDQANDSQQDKTTPIVIRDSPYSTESRLYLQYLKRKQRDSKSDLYQDDGRDDGKRQTSPALSKLTTVHYVDAAIVDRTANSNKQAFSYRPAELTVSSSRFYPSGRYDYNTAEIKGFFDSFETDNGYSLLVIKIPDQELNQSNLSVQALIKTPDDQTLMFNLRLNLATPEDERYQCKKEPTRQYCTAKFNLTAGDRELLAYWDNQPQDTAWVKQDQQLRQLVAQKKYDAVVTLAGELLSEDKPTVAIPDPIAGEWIYLTAEAYRHLGRQQEAGDWYRKLVTEFPWSDLYASAWYRLLDLNGKGVFQQ